MVPTCNGTIQRTASSHKGSRNWREAERKDERKAERETEGVAEEVTEWETEWEEARYWLNNKSIIYFCIVATTSREHAPQIGESVLFSAWICRRTL